MRLEAIRDHHHRTAKIEQAQAKDGLYAKLVVMRVCRNMCFRRSVDDKEWLEPAWSKENDGCGTFAVPPMTIGWAPFPA
jgi:hypothetical protein